MLQELTENDFKYVHYGINKTNLLKIYNVLKKWTEENKYGLGVFQRYYFDDTFYWKRPVKKVKKRNY